MNRLHLVSFAFFLSWATLASGQVEFLGVKRIPGNTKDQSGLYGELEGGVPINNFGGLSAIDYTGANDEYWALSDRGAGDGVVSYPCRAHKIKLVVDPNAKQIQVEQVSTILLKDQSGTSLTGSEARMLQWNGQGRCPSYDPEGFRLTAQGQFIVSDEYGPFVDRFGADGILLQEIPLPEKFSLGTRRKPAFSRGTYTNRGMEGLALTPNGQRFVVAMQGPLIQDGRVEKGKCLGVKTRWVTGEFATGKMEEWTYPLSDESTGVSEVLSIDENRYLVIERDSAVASAAKIKHIYLADVRGASDVSEVESLIAPGASKVREISKKLFIDLLDPNYGLNGDQAPGKPEGLAWGPELADGRKLLIVCFDNDFREDIETIFVAFAIRDL